MATLSQLKTQHRHKMESTSVPVTSPKSETFGTTALRDTETEADAQSATWQTITLSLPADTALAIPADPARWERRDGRIIATYTREELTWAAALALKQRQADLEARLEWWLEVLAAATGCDDDEAERLLAHWEALNVTYTAAVTALAAVSQSVNSENPALKDQ